MSDGTIARRMRNVVLRSTWKNHRKMVESENPMFTLDDDLQFPAPPVQCEGVKGVVKMLDEAVSTTARTYSTECELMHVEPAVQAAVPWWKSPPVEDAFDELSDANPRRGMHAIIDEIMSRGFVDPSLVDGSDPSGLLSAAAFALYLTF